MQAVLEERELLRLTAEALQCEAGADAILEQVARLRRDGRVVEVGRSPEGQPVYATPTMIAAERAMLRVAYTRQDERAFVPDEVVTRVLADRPSLRPEQRAAVRHALNRDGLSVVEGSAGSGKSYAMASVAEAVRACDGEVWVIAPSWKAVDVIRTDTATAEAMARAVTGFLNRIDKGEITLGPRTAVIADEAGMIGRAISPRWSRRRLQAEPSWSSAATRASSPRWWRVRRCGCSSRRSGPPGWTKSSGSAGAARRRARGCGRPA